MSRSRLKLSIAAALIGASSLLGPSAFADQDKTYAYWDRTKLDLNNLVDEEVLSNDSCNKSVSTLQGCFAVINALGEFTKPRTAMRVKREFVESERILSSVVYKTEKVIASMGQFELVTLADKNEATEKTSAEAKESALEKRIHRKIGTLAEQTLFNELTIQQTRNQGYSFAAVQLVEPSMLHSSPASLSPFEAAFVALKPLLDREVSEAYISGQMYNTWLSYTVDPHTYLRPTKETADELQSGDADTFVGLGVEIKPVDKNIYVMDFIGESPAKIAGIEVGDVLSKADGVPLADKPLPDAIKLLRGEPGSLVKVTVTRDGKEIDFVVKRMPVVSENVTTRKVTMNGKQFQYIRVRTFMDERLAEKVKHKLKQIDRTKVSGIILDLRNNGGGLLDQAVDMGALFVGKNKVIVHTVNLQSNQVESLASTDMDQATDLPMVTLINEGSASASELVSGALQDYDRSWVVGVRSFGKGSAQGSHPLKSDPELTASMTIALFYHPSGKSNQIEGVHPEFEVWPDRNKSEYDYAYTTREEDLYLNAISTEAIEVNDGPNIDLQARRQAASRIKDCVDRMQLPSSLDNQLQYAQAVLACQ